MHELLGRTITVRIKEMRAKIAQDEQGCVTLEYDSEDPTGTVIRVRHVYFCPIGGGYVRDQHGKQVCERLSSVGVTLLSSRVNLLKTIRRAYTAMRRAEKEGPKPIRASPHRRFY